MGNVVTAKPKIGGSIFYAPVGTALPTDASTALNASFKSVGYISEDGVDNDDTITTNEIKDWSGETVLVVETGHSDEFKFTMLDAVDENAMKLRYGSANVSGAIATGITAKSNINVGEAVSIVIEMVLQEQRKKRIVIPSCKASSFETIKYKADTAIGYGVTMKATADTNGNTHYDYTQKVGQSQS